MTIYMQVTSDEYELPVAVADSVKGLAKLAGVNEKTICSSISHMKSGRNKTSIYRRVEVEDEEED